MSSQPRSILRSTGRASTKRPLVWDEGNLDLNESEKVPRMKVDEPKTPFHHKHRKFEYDTSNESTNSSMRDVEHAQSEQHDWDWEDEPISESIEPAPMDDSLHVHECEPAVTNVTQPGDDDENVVEDHVTNTIDDNDDSESSGHSAQFAAMRSAHYKMGDLLRAHELDEEEDES